MQRKNTGRIEAKINWNPNGQRPRPRGRPKNKIIEAILGIKN